MDSTLFKEVDNSLGKLMQDIPIGSLSLPDIQRLFVRPNARIRGLFDSMFKDYRTQRQVWRCGGTMGYNWTARATS